MRTVGIWPSLQNLMDVWDHSTAVLLCRQASQLDSQNKQLRNTRNVFCQHSALLVGTMISDGPR